MVTALDRSVACALAHKRDVRPATARPNERRRRGARKPYDMAPCALRRGAGSYIIHGVGEARAVTAVPSGAQRADRTKPDDRHGTVCAMALRVGRVCTSTSALGHSTVLRTPSPLEASELLSPCSGRRIRIQSAAPASALHDSPPCPGGIGSLIPSKRCPQGMRRIALCTSTHSTCHV